MKYGTMVNNSPSLNFSLMTPILFLFLLIISVTTGILWIQVQKSRRENFIRSYMFPTGLLEKLGKIRPELSLKDQQLVARALRQFFLVYLKSGKKHIAMPSQVVDDLWHEFILYTKSYDQFCRKAFGQYMHHTPAAVLGKSRQNNDGLRRTWWFACLEENINPKKATRLPLLFALDGKWDIKDGFHYAPDCKQLRERSDGTVYCGGDFYSGDFGSNSSSSDYNDSSGNFGFSSDSSIGDSGSDGGSSDSGSSDSGSGCSGGCGGGCGGGGGD